MIKDYCCAHADEIYRGFIEDPSSIPIAFSYGGVKYCGIPATPHRAETKSYTEGGRKIYEISTRIDTALLLKIKCSSYPTHGGFEFTAVFENDSDRDSELIENIEFFMELRGENPMLRGILGDWVNQYSPYEKDLTVAPVFFESNTGRPTHVQFPYFNLEYGDGGIMLAIGWAGTWSAGFEYSNGVTRYTAKTTNGICTRLAPGEHIRSGLFTCIMYSVRDESYATNCWRDWFIKYNQPKQDATGADIAPFSCTCLAGDTGLPNVDGSISERYYTWRPSLQKIVDEKLAIDFRWFDAGWYIAPDMTSSDTEWWSKVGTWELDPVKWPDGSFLESTEFARAHGMRTLMWFEPERVTDPESLAKNFGYNVNWAIQREGVEAISNNIGDPECLKWTTDRICQTLRDNKVEMYREDNNCDPGELWRYMDTLEGEGRRGITECKIVEAHYKMWDSIIACTLSYGGCGFVDSCASGGGRNDLESLRRGIPLLRSDKDRTSTSLRLSMTSSFNRWIPFCGATTNEREEMLSNTGVSDIYTWRASYLPCLNVSSKYALETDGSVFDMLRRGLNEWSKLNKFLLCEFYPLTPWHNEYDKSGFTAFLYLDPKTEEGIVLAFRREECKEDNIELSLPLEASLTDEDTGCVLSTKDGRVTLTFDCPRQARLLWVKPAK